MSAPELPRPGVEVIQVIQTTSPTVITPTLPPVNVGLCKQIVDAVVASGTTGSVPNSQAVVSLPALFLMKAAAGTPPKYTGLDGKVFVFSVTNGPDVEVTFSDGGGGLSPASVAAQVNSALLSAGETGARADAPVSTKWRLSTLGKGQYFYLEVRPGTDDEVLGAFGLAIGQSVAGADTYAGRSLDVHVSSFPDPRNNLSQVSVDASTVRAFLQLSSSSLREALRTESFLRRGNLATPAVVAAPSKDLDANGSLVLYATQGVAKSSGSVTKADYAAIYSGGGSDLSGKDFVFTLNGVVKTVTLSSPLTDETTLLADLNAAVGVGFASLGTGGDAGKLILRNPDFGAAKTIVLAAGAPGDVDPTDLKLTLGTYTGSNGDLHAQTLTLRAVGKVSGVSKTSTLAVTFSLVEDSADVLSQIAAVTMDSAVDVKVTPTLATGKLTLTTVLTGATTSLTVVSGSSVTNLGLTLAQTDTGESAAAAVDDGNGDNRTPLIQLNGEDFTTAATAAVVTGTTNVTFAGTPALYGNSGTLKGTTIVLSDGRAPQEFTIPEVANDAALLTALNGFFGTAAGGKITATLSGNNLRLTHADKGDESIIDVISGTSLALLGLDTKTGKTRGLPFPPQTGDELWVSGQLLGLITKVAPGGLVDVVQISKQIAIEANLGADWYMVAKKLTGAQTSTRPSADLTVSAEGDVSLKAELIRDTMGAPTESKATVYVAYEGVRKDVTALAVNPGLLTFGSSTEISSMISPISTKNPLGLAAYLTAINAPGIQSYALGVDAMSADAPYGTPEAFTRAAEFLESFEVYSLVPLTRDITVAQTFLAHAASMSASQNKGERIVFFSSAPPTTKLDTLVASGVGDTIGGSGLIFDTKIANLPALLLAAGIDPTQTIPVEAGLILDIASSAYRYSIESVSGSTVTIRIAFMSGENDDAFYTTTKLNTDPLPASLIEEAFTVKVRGASLVNVDGTIDKAGMAETYAALGGSFGNRRFNHIVLDKVGVTLNGLEQLVEGFYACSMIAGMVGQQPPQQSFTNFPMVGATRVTGTNKFFTEKQLNQIAGGGNWILVQDSQGAPVMSRMALTTDMTSIETRTDSITKVIDFVAKFLRTGLRNFIGRFNITQSFLDSLGSVLHGLLGFLVENGVLIGAHPNNIMQDESAPDSVLIDVTLDVPYPCNFIRLTLIL